MRWMPLAALLLLAILSGCAHPKAIPYPQSAAGEALRKVYTGAPDANGACSYLSRTTTDPNNPAAPPAVTPADRAALQPAMLAILRQDDSERALHIALLLSQWDLERKRPTTPADCRRLLAATAPEFRRLVPAIIRGLDAPNEDDGSDMQRWSAMGSVMLLSCMGPDATYPYRDAIARRFNASVNAKIQGESNECWTRTWLGGILVTLGKDGVPGLVQGLDHADSMVRDIALMSLHALAVPGSEEMFIDRWHDSPAHQAAARLAARSAAPKVIDHLWDPDTHVRDYAAGILPSLMDRSALTPRVQGRLLDMLVVGDGEPNDGAAAAMAGFHPAFTPILLDYVTKEDDPHYFGAVKALHKIGRPVVPDLIARLAADKEFPNQGPSAVLQLIGPPAIAGLAQAAASDPNPATRERAAFCLGRNVKDARRNIAANARYLDDPNPSTVMASIRVLCENAPVAAPALPALERLATQSPDAQVRTATKAAIEQITRERLDLLETK